MSEKKKPGLDAIDVLRRIAGGIGQPGKVEVRVLDTKSGELVLVESVEVVKGQVHIMPVKGDTK